MNKTHALAVPVKYGYEEVKSFCGLRGVRDRVISNEFLTVMGVRWEIAERGYKPTCARCKKAAVNQQSTTEG